MTSRQLPKQVQKQPYDEQRNDPSFVMRFFRPKGPFPDYADGPACRICGSPWHPSTGDVRIWCGPCCRSMIKTFKECRFRRTHGYNFWEHCAPLNNIESSNQREN